MISPKKAGTAYIQVSHPQAEFPLDITVRVVEIVENVYVQPNTTTLILNGLGENTGTISASLVGISEGKECLTVLDFIGQSNKNYKFADKLSARAHIV